MGRDPGRPVKTRDRSIAGVAAAGIIAAAASFATAGAPAPAAAAAAAAAAAGDLLRASQ